MGPTPDALMRRWFDEVWNQGREAAIDEMFAPNGVVHGLVGGDINGPGAFRPIFHTFRGAFPDIHFTVLRTIVEGDFAAVHVRVTGTHSGDTLGIAPSGKKVEFEGMTIGRIVEGQFHEGWNAFDLLTMYQQIGVVAPVPGA